ncbi:MAG: DinB family protein [Bacteroidota bacterium]
MTTRLIAKPGVHQYPPYAATYIEKVPDDGRVFDHLASGIEEVIKTIDSLTEEQLLYRYEVDKWTIKEILVHLMDAERVFAYRGLRCARKDKTPIPGFDHNSYVPASEANDRTLTDILAEYRAQRTATIAFFSHLSDAALDEVGVASTLPCSAKAMTYMIAGHEQHHLRIIRERYLN